MMAGETNTPSKRNKRVKPRVFTKQTGTRRPGAFCIKLVPFAKNKTDPTGSVLFFWYAVSGMDYDRFPILIELLDTRYQLAYYKIKICSYTQ